MNFLLVTIGSHGDVHPFIGLAGALKQRGHRVAVVVNPHFESIVRRAGIDFVPLGSEESFVEAKGNPDLWHGTRGAETILRLISPLIRQTYDAIVANAVPGETVVVASSLGLGARIAQEKLGLPTAMVHLSPAIIRSIERPPVLPGVTMPRWLPRSIVRRMFDAGDYLIVDKVLAPPVNELRGELGLPPVRGIFRDYVHSPELVIGLFPEWFCPPPADWPPQVRLTGFPLWDEREIGAMRDEVYNFVNAPGGPPVVFTPGSANHHAHDFFAAAVDACGRIGVRGMLLSRHREHVPPNLPDTIRHVDYAPFSQLFPLAAAVVHHGGIGTSAQALAAGTRQLITWMAHDQPDNAARLVKLEVARSIPARRVNGRRLARELKALLDDRAYHVRCHWVSQWFKGQQALVDTAKLLEEFGREKLSSTSPSPGTPGEGWGEGLPRAPHRVAV